MSKIVIPISYIAIIIIVSLLLLHYYDYIVIVAIIRYVKDTENSLKTLLLIIL